MSGVVKDDPTPPEGETPAAPAVDPTPPEAPQRKVAPHLRVVADNSDLSEDATVRSVPHMRAGARLRAARENLGLTLEQVSRDTRVTITHLRAIEDMTPSLLGARVYAEGHIRTYARHLRLNAEEILTQYRAECAILADPQKTEIEPPAPPRKGPPVGPILGGAVVLALAGVGAYFLLSSNQPAGRTQAAATEEARDAAPAAGVVATAPDTPVSGPLLRIVALQRARIEVRGADGTKFLARYFEPGEDYPPRVGAGWTVTTNDGAAFEWRLGDVSLGLLAPEGGPVYAQSVDAALSREPVAVPFDPALAEPTTPSETDANAAAPVQPGGQPAAAAARPRTTPARPSRPEAQPATASAAAEAPPEPAAAPAVEEAPAVDPFDAN